MGHELGSTVNSCVKKIERVNDIMKFRCIFKQFLQQMLIRKRWERLKFKCLLKENSFYVETKDILGGLCNTRSNCSENYNDMAHLVFKMGYRFRLKDLNVT